MTDTDSSGSSSSRLAFSDMITNSLHRVGRLPDEAMIEHVIALAATVIYDAAGRPHSAVHRIYPAGNVNGYIERGMLADALRDSEREADREDRGDRAS